MIYKRCISCGNFFISDKPEENENYCSNECSIKFVRCTMCGNFFQRDKDDEDDKFICCETFIEEFRYKRKINTMNELIS